jgi:hypothetical protein
MMDNITSNNNANFYWWFGVVEDRNDPLRLGRCRVRIIGYHTEDTEVLPPEDLPWALPVMPANSAGTSGVGWSPTGAVTGSWVVGFFADGENGQHPMFFGTVGAIPGGLRAGDCPPEDGAGSPSDSATGDGGGGTSGSTGDAGAPVASGPPNQEFWTLVAICAAEAGIGGGKGQDQCDVAQSIYNRAAAGDYGSRSVLGVILANGQYEPTWRYPGDYLYGANRRKLVAVRTEWRNITDANTAARALGKRGFTPQAMLTVAGNLKNSEYQNESRRFIGNRTDFRGGRPQDLVPATRVIRPAGSGGARNHFGFNVRGNYRGAKGVAQIPAFVNNQAIA